MSRIFREIFLGDLGGEKGASLSSLSLGVLGRERGRGFADDSERSCQCSRWCNVHPILFLDVISNRNHSATVSTVQKICDGLEIHIRDFFASPLFDETEQEVR